MMLVSPASCRRTLNMETRLVKRARYIVARELGSKTTRRGYTVRMSILLMPTGVGLVCLGSTTSCQQCSCLNEHHQLHKGKRKEREKNKRKRRWRR